MIEALNFFSNAYQKLTHSFLATEVQEEEEVRVPEKVIRCVWNDQMFKPGPMQTVDGKSIEISFPGYWNFGSGPDFKSAAVRVDGELHEGDVELHVYGTDWRAHGHSQNNDYDNVILHVFLWKGRGHTPVTTQRDTYSRPHIFELELKNYLSKGILKLNEELDFDSYPLLNQFNFGLCHKPLAALNPEQFLTLLNQAGDGRIQAKMDRFHDRIIIKGYEQAFYEGVAEAMGYPSNKAPFRTLAETLSLEALARATAKAKSAEERILTLQALLFGVSGLIDWEDLDTKAMTPEGRSYFSGLQTIWETHASAWQGLKISRQEWKFGRMRPANFPYRRIAALSHLIVRHWNTGLFADCLETARQVMDHPEDKRATARAIKHCFEFFCLEADDYWARHYTPGGKTLKNNQHLIGPDRSREVVINILLPIGLIFARAGKSLPLEQALSRIYQTRKPPADNQWIRFMKRYLLGDRPPMINQLTGDRQTQGLMQIYQDFCTKNENNCLQCQFPKVVERYFP